MYFFHVYQDSQHLWRWTFYAPNNRKMADSGESYNTRQSCESAIAVLKREVPTAPVR